MVKSGLSLDPHVSHFRLAAHLLLALGLLLFLAWSAWDLEDVPEQGAQGAPQGLRRVAWTFFGLLILQVTYGAFVAGLKAGFSFNTFPKMGDFWVPPGLLSHLEPWVSNLVSNSATVQFIHRGLAWALLFSGFGMAWTWGWSARGAAVTLVLRRALSTLAALLLLQFALGVATLLLAVPVWLGVAHQLGAALLLLAGARLLFVVRTP
jgi:cytochrome c oxidase assembly protein subunit 15